MTTQIYCSCALQLIIIVCLYINNTIISLYSDFRQNIGDGTTIPVVEEYDNRSQRIDTQMGTNIDGHNAINERVANKLHFCGEGRFVFGNYVAPSSFFEIKFPAFATIF